MDRIEKIKKYMRDGFPRSVSRDMAHEFRRSDLQCAVEEIERLKRGLQVPVPGDQDTVPDTSLYVYLIGLGMPEGIPSLSSEQQAEWLRSVFRVSTAVRARLEAGISKLEEENERLKAALSPFAAIGKTIVPNWPGCCRLRIDARADGSEYQCYHGTPDEQPTLSEWRKAAEASA